MLACGKTNQEISPQPSAVRKDAECPTLPRSLGRVGIFDFHLTAPISTKVNFPAPSTGGQGRLCLAKLRRDKDGAPQALAFSNFAPRLKALRHPKADSLRTFFLFIIFFSAQQSIELKLERRTHSARRCVIVFSGVCRIGKSGDFLLLGGAALLALR
jgi:hypothetical protein